MSQLVSVSSPASGREWSAMTPEERVAAIRPLRDAGHSAKQIATALSAPSRDAILGYVFRHLEMRPDKRWRWTIERRTTVERLAREGKTLDQIAAELGAPAQSIYEMVRGLSIHMPAGRKIGRPKAPSKHGRERDKGPASKATTERFLLDRISRPPKKTARMPKLRDIPVENPKPFTDRRMGFECAWIVGDPREPDPHCCGAPTELGASWCKPHREIVFGRPA
jgi:hypothetical protein